MLAEPQITVVIEGPERVAICINPRIVPAAYAAREAPADKRLQAPRNRSIGEGYAAVDDCDLAWCAGFYESPDGPNF
jgi:hypothetical protein